MVRVFRFSPVGKVIVPSVSSSTRHCTPRRARSMATIRPTGPPPMISTGMGWTGVVSLMAITDSLGEWLTLAQGQWRPQWAPRGGRVLAIAGLPADRGLAGAVNTVAKNG